MSVQSKAIIQTLKSVAVFLAALVAFYFLLNFLGPKLGLILMLVSLIGWFTWLTYSFYIDKFTFEEKFKL